MIFAVRCFLERMRVMLITQNTTEHRQPISTFRLSYFAHIHTVLVRVGLDGNRCPLRKSNRLDEVDSWVCIWFSLNTTVTQTKQAGRPAEIDFLSAHLPRVFLFHQYFLYVFHLILRHSRFPHFPD